MCNSEKILFVDKVVSLLRRFCPEMSSQVMYWVACQFALESNYGTSYRAVKCHNLCGMKIPHVRFSLNLAVNGEFAQFKDDSDCVLDYVLWLAYNKVTSMQVANLDLYRQRIVACKYCSEVDYIDRVDSIYNQLK